MLPSITDVLTILPKYCGTCPMTLCSFIHPLHQLHILRQPQPTFQNDRFCNACDDSVEGLFYRCNSCDFDVHPLCTQLPQQEQHFLHPTHQLTLQQFPPSPCLVCKNNCTSWRYRCSICCVDIHLECLLTASDTLTSASASTSTSTPPPVPRSVWQPSAPAAAPPPVFGTYGYQTPPFGNAYADGFQTPPAFCSYGYQITAPFGSAYASGAQDPAVGAYNYQFGTPFVSSPSNMYHHQHPSGNHQNGGDRFRTRMYRILGALSLGVLSNGLSDVIFGD